MEHLSIQLAAVRIGYNIRLVRLLARALGSRPCFLRLPASTGGGAVRVSRTGRAARRRRMLRVVGLCGGAAPGGTAG